MTRIGPIKAALVAGGIYYLVVQATLIGLVVLTGDGSLGPLEPDNVIALFSGMVTAMGLAAIYFQFRASEQAARMARDDARRRSALELDAMHSFFNGRGMRGSRDLAWIYLRYLVRKNLMHEYASFWVSNRAAPTVPTLDEVVELFGQREATALEALPASERNFSAFSWGVSLMVSFYTRLHGHLVLAYGEDVASSENRTEISRIVGQFFWEYWREPLLALAAATEVEAHEEGGAEFGVPYFVEPLRELDGYVDRPKGSSTARTQPDPTPDPADRGRAQD